MLVVAALILGASVVAAAVLIQQSIDNAAGQISEVGKAVAAMPAGGSGRACRR